MDPKGQLEDEKLAEASLLSHFFAQSHKEQMILDNHIKTSPNLIEKSVNSPISTTKKVYKSVCLNTSHSCLKLVAVHLGAGNSTKINQELVELSKKVCEDVMYQHSNVQNILNHSNQNKKQKLSPCENEEMKSSEPNITAELASVQLVKLLEDHHLLNCGYGSNLTIDGHVECDASMMFDKTQLWTGVGGLSGCKNPILLVETMYQRQTVPLPLDLVQPNLLVAAGARKWMKANCPHLSRADSKLICSKAFKDYQKLKSKFDVAVKSQSFSPDSSYEISNFAQSKNNINGNGNMQETNYATKRASSTELDHGFYCRKDQTNNTDFNLEFSDNSHDKSSLYVLEVTGDLQTDFDRMDTVGAVVVDCNNNYATAISSGGIVLKHQGRLGQAAVPGAGCWAKDSVAVTTSGVGEYLTVNTFARNIYDNIRMMRNMQVRSNSKDDFEKDESLLDGCIEKTYNEFLSSPSLSHVNHLKKYAAVLLAASLKKNDTTNNHFDTEAIGLSFAHNTNSMYIGYMSNQDCEAKSIFSLRDDQLNAGKPLIKTIILPENQKLYNEK